MATDPSVNNVLLVPMRMDALCSTGEIPVREGFADFSKLPYLYRLSGKQDPANPVANLSDQVLSQPFSSSQLRLPAGIHLHWALPDALTHSSDSDEQGRLRFPIVPNRWLVTRSRHGTVEKQWVVESDYLYPDLSGIPKVSKAPAAVTVPFPINDSEKGPYAAFRYMGRQFTPGSAPPSHPEYLSTYNLALTAMGAQEWWKSLDHVSATFAAYYPNCYSVFGCCDEDHAVAANPQGVQYEVLGFYDNGTQDILSAWLAAYPKTADREQQLADFQSQFGWKTDLGDAAFPVRTVLYARLTFAASPVPSDPPSSQVTLALGNTATEALAAYLAQQLAADDKSLAKSVVEEQLVALQFVDKLAQKQVDLGAQFQEYRHEKGFIGQRGGMLWSVQQADDPGKKSDEIDLPDDLAHQLNELNQLQLRFDRENDISTAMSERLYGDWCKAMMCMYPEGYDDIPITEVQLTNLLWDFENSAVTPLRQQRTATGQLQWLKNEQTGEVIGQAMELRFGIVAYDEDTTDDYSYTKYLHELEGDGSLPSDGYWYSECDACGIPFSDRARVASVHRGGDRDEGAEWSITDGAQTYRIKVEGGVMYLYISPFGAQLASQLVQSIAALRDRIAGLNPPCVLRPIPGPRYWQPSDPVVLMIGDAVQPSRRHGHEGQLACQLIPGIADADLQGLGTNKQLQDKLRQAIDAVRPSDGQEQIGFSQWTRRPWNPLLLEWDVELFPHPYKSGSKNPDDPFAPDYITSRYKLATGAVDLTGPSADLDDSRIYQNFCILTPNATKQFKHWIGAYVVRERGALPDTYMLDLYGMKDAEAVRYLHDNVQAILDAYEPAEHPDPLRMALLAFQRLEGLVCLSQALGGFNDALQMQQRTMQLGIADPLVDELEFKLFTTQIAGVMSQDVLLQAPNSGQAFSPIRSGEMKIGGLRLVDSFGQCRDLATDPTAGATLLAVEQMTKVLHGPDDHRFQLPPRLSQPARLRFRFRSGAPIAGHDDPEMNDHPATTPICGWLLPNNLDCSLMIYAANGTMLGLVNTSGRWQPAPGSDRPIAVDGIENPYLRQLVDHLTTAGAAGYDYVAAFLDVLDKALDEIQPESAAQHPELALLMARPVALVRTAVKLELQGLPAIDKSWDVFTANRNDYPDNSVPISENPVKWTRAFDQVQFPVRIGELGQLNDGVVGYWRENDDGTYADGTFYSPQSGHANFSGSGADTRKIVTEQGAPMNLLVSASAPPQVLCMLVDPRGELHATSGILPTKSIRIPPDQYAAALRTIEVTFLSAPLLTPQRPYAQPGATRQLAVPLPTESGYAWSWLSRQSGAWEESSAMVDPDSTARLSGPQQLCEGWLKIKAEPSDSLLGNKKRISRP